MHAELPAIRRHETAPRLPADFRISFRSLYGNSLVSRINQVDAHVCAAHEEGIEMPAVETENHTDAELMETLREEVAAEEFASFWLLEVDSMGRHGGVV
jgi:hypothetical protein